ncbi:MAG: hypothetical protein A3E83_04040 [Gammaproteobacteria bacterium RIFCSPHIGHO2_12_FULL_41_20]|nr:MAG: hypothetical protein A3E83_04040 [Gammaproteobacteria bacterium RIFCSPHIGHO2_12_FULL_41_20]
MNSAAPVSSLPTGSSTLTTSAEAKDAQPGTADENDIMRFTGTIALIKDFYVQSTQDKQLLENAIRGMVNGLDPHSEYLDQESYKTLMMTTSGEFGGIGIEVAPEFGVLKIISPIDDTPAQKVGLKAGDYVVALDGKLVSEMSLKEAIEKMRGKSGTEMTLTILRKGNKSPLVFKLTREMIHIQSVKSKMLDNNVGYVRITQFQEPSAKLMQEAIRNLQRQSNNHLSGVILDLRNNPGGLLESAVGVADTFLDSNTLKNRFNNVIVYTDGRLPEAQYKAKATTGDILNGAPLIVLINSGSASASEIVAGALQDYHRAVIIGETSFGKGSVQTVLPLDKNHAIKLTTALYHTPSGRVIQNVGIIPDIAVENLKIQKNAANDDLAMIEPLKEYQLKNHIATTDSNPLNATLQAQNDFALASEDFQLFQALKILRTMHVVGQMQNQSTTTVAKAAS